MYTDKILEEQIISWKLRKDKLFGQRRMSKHFEDIWSLLILLKVWLYMIFTLYIKIDSPIILLFPTPPLIEKMGFNGNYNDNWQ